MRYSSIAIAALSTTVGIALVQATSAWSAFRFGPSDRTAAQVQVVAPSDSMVATVSQIASTTSGPVVLLTPKGTRRSLPIWIGHAEARAIERAHFNIDMPRPATHDLLANIIDRLDAQVAHVSVDRLREDGVYTGTVTLVHGDQILAIDARPSDAIALALRTDRPIYMANTLRRQLVDISAPILSDLR
ncbi:MAG: bifunctional nuclease family protein [Myxococcota bacterium]